MEAVKSYLQVRRVAGFDLRHTGILLSNFARFATERSETHVVSSTAIEWSSLGVSLGERDRRLKAVIRFARYVRTEDVKHDIPPDGLYGKHRQRRTAFIFSPLEVKRVVEQAGQLGPNGSLRPHTYAALFSLLSATGLRISEALSLRFGDLTTDGLLIRQTKFRKSRLVPLHETVIRGLERYMVHRRECTGSDDHLFVSLRGQGLCYETVRNIFHKVVRTAGIEWGANRRAPQIHSFRHTFAVRALETFRCDRDRVGQHLLALSTYLGHAHVADTYWYLQTTPELLGDIAASWETFVKGAAR